jgi:hypothetical protein
MTVQKLRLGIAIFASVILVIVTNNNCRKDIRLSQNYDDEKMAYLVN